MNDMFINIKNNTVKYQRSFLIYIVLLCLSTSCNKKNALVVEVIEEPIIHEYQITKGACGKIVYQEKLGNDFNIALSALNDNLVKIYGDKIYLDYFEIEVEDSLKKIPKEKFYAIIVKEKGTNVLFHSVYHVITSNGLLYYIFWCPD